jgi:RNA polymerase sigma-70 factor (ECF subfamily)
MLDAPGEVLKKIRTDIPARQSGSVQDRATFLEAIAGQYRSALIGFFRRRAHTLGGEEEDLAQEVLVRLAQRRTSDEIERVEAYLFQTASSVLKDRIRSRAARRVDAHVLYKEDAHALEDFSPEHVLLAQEELRQVIQALSELPGRVRAAFLLHRLEGLGQAEIARRLSVSTSSVEKYIVRALAHVVIRVRRGDQ